MSVNGARGYIAVVGAGYLLFRMWWLLVSIVKTSHSDGGCDHLNVDSNEKERDPVNGVNVDFLLAEDVRRKYYELCVAQKSYLHDPQMSVNHILASGIIIETTEIADHLRRCNGFTLADELAKWDEKLKALEIFGMKVGFILSQLSHLWVLAKMRAALVDELHQILPCHQNVVDKETQSLRV